MNAIFRHTALKKIAAFILTMAAATNSAAPTPPLRLKTLMDVPLGGRATRLDYASVDADRQLLFIAHLGDGEVIVVDTEAHRLVKRIANVAAVQATESAKAANRSWRATPMWLPFSRRLTKSISRS
jgi:hypothetical protein